MPVWLFVNSLAASSQRVLAPCFRSCLCVQCVLQEYFVVCLLMHINTPMTYSLNVLHVANLMHIINYGHLMLSQWESCRSCSGGQEVGWL